jgi:ribonuclease T2
VSAAERQTLRDAPNEDLNGNLNDILSDLKDRAARNGQDAGGVAVPQPGPSAAAHELGAVPMQFDYYVLALSWEPAFCETKPDRQDCRSLNADRFDGKNLALHGLWPNKIGDTQHAYGYCGVDGSVQKLDRPGDFCQLPPVNLSDRIMSDLATYMPGHVTCLERHEWFRHGTCSGLAADDYFATADALVVQFAAASIGSYISAHVGDYVAGEDLFAAFEKDFGPGSRGSLSLSCKRINGSDMLSEVDVYLRNPLPAGGLAAMLVRPDGSASGHCPQKFLIDPVHPLH